MVQLAALAGLIAVFSFGCSSGSGGDSFVESTVGAAPEIQGVFVDSPVAGLDYMTPTHTGVTDSEGRFTCFEGEMISFMIGDVMLGQALAGEVITPMDFLNESETPFDVTHPMITNMGRFLQSLDSDGNPENGITISDEVRAEITGRMIDFHQSIEDFENDPDVIACFDVFNGLNIPHSGMMWGLFEAEQAQAHMREHMGFGLSDGSGDDFEPPMGQHMDEEMIEYMEEHMGFDLSEGPGEDFEPPMGQYMDEEMIEYMEEHMGFDWSEGPGENFDPPMGQHMDEEMIEYMNEHMGFDSSENPGEDFEFPMGQHMDEEMIEYMNEHMGFGGDSDGEIEHPMGGQMGEYMESRMGSRMGYRS